MQAQSDDVPRETYGIRPSPSSPPLPRSEEAEEIGARGFAILDAGLDEEAIDELRARFDDVYERYRALHGAEALAELGEGEVVRAPLLHDEAFLRLALNGRLLRLVGELIDGTFLLHQQNGVFNPPQRPYGQGAWHRDFPYQDFLSDTPLGVNALFCIDDFRADNGATFVLPGSHREKRFPPRPELTRRALQVEAPRGSFLVMDSMLFHAGGANASPAPRRAVNHLFSIPYFRQQIHFPGSLAAEGLSADARRLLGFEFPQCESVEDFLAWRRAKQSEQGA